MKYEFLIGDDVLGVSSFSQSVGNTSFVPGQSAVAVMKEAGKIIGFAAVENAVHCAGSWIDPQFRQKGLSYRMRAFLEKSLKDHGVQVYFSIPNTEAERTLFLKYGGVKERMVQVKVL